MSRLDCPLENIDCKYFDSDTGCYSDCHHAFWPRPDYETRTEKQFRELTENKDQLCRWEHDQLHFEMPPDKPNLEFMLGRLSIERSTNV